MSPVWGDNLRCSKAVVPSPFGIRDSFMEDSFSTDPGGGRRRFQDDSNALHLLCILFLLYTVIYNEILYNSS